jgi:DNA polymerase-3 subunit gamma/tau
MASLTAQYRPRRFADVAGQDAVKAILSRASATGRIAPAYMFSGTRGVGKTTIARIFAKALNCEKAPAAEPCNECRMCRQANAGNAVDIIEIDAASHGGVGDVRALKEDVGYAPLEGRYKVFIIDEAHMLSTAAFNALLKTLEEPPARVTFILASTEAHKFPATILSRCQHYVFKMLPQDGLVAHLEGILKAENVDYEHGAVRIIARRGAGSVRDSISLLGQALAYSAGALKESEVRACLGLDRKSTRLNSSHNPASRMPSSA